MRPAPRARPPTSSPGGREAEGEAAIRAAGIPLVTAEQDKERRGDILQRRAGAAPPGGSTWQSVTRGTGSTEVDYLAGEIVLLGRLHGVPTPACELIQQVTNDLARRRAAPGAWTPPTCSPGSRGPPTTARGPAHP